MAKFNERLRELRLKKNISLEKMAKDLGTTKATLSRYENGLRDPKTEVTKKFAEYFGVSVDYLIGNTDKPNIELIDSGLPQELINEGIEAIEVFKGVKLIDLGQDDIKKLVEFAKKIKNRP